MASATNAKPKKRGFFQPKSPETPPKPLKKGGFARVPVQSLTPDQLLASICRSSFFDFVRTFWDVVIPEKPVWNWHIEFLCNELQELAEGVFAGKKKRYDLTINISPGTTKSTIVSIMFQAWLWTRMPSARVISCSYAHSLATDHSRKSRDVIRSELYQRLFPEVKLRDDQDAKGHFVNTRGGERYAFGIFGGAVTGKHAHFLIVDDPLNPGQAVSEADLATVNRFMEETLPSRKVDKSTTPTILIMQRLHENDPTGARVEKEGRLPHRHICLPAELTDDVKPTYLRNKYIDGLMDPTRLNAEVLAEAEAQGDYLYSSQYLQSPIPRGSAMFMIEKMVVGVPPAKFERVVRFFDKAGTSGGGAYTVGVKMGVTKEKHYWVLDVIRVQFDSGARETLIRRTAIKDGKGVIVGVEQEPGSGGKHSSQSTVANLSGFTTRVVKVGKSEGDKIDRADAFSSQVNVGNVSIAEGKWNRDYLGELRFFPRSRYKDQVDASSGAFNVLAGARRKLGGVPRGRKVHQPTRR